MPTPDLPVLLLCHVITVFTLQVYTKSFNLSFVYLVFSFIVWTQYKPLGLVEDWQFHIDIFFYSSLSTLLTGFLVTFFTLPASYKPLVTSQWGGNSRGRHVIEGVVATAAAGVMFLGTIFVRHQMPNNFSNDWNTWVGWMLITIGICFYIGTILACLLWPFRKDGELYLPFGLASRSGEKGDRIGHMIHDSRMNGKYIGSMHVLILSFVMPYIYFWDVGLYWPIMGLGVTILVHAANMFVMGQLSMRAREQSSWTYATNLWNAGTIGDLDRFKSGTHFQMYWLSVALATVVMAVCGYVATGFALSLEDIYFVILGSQLIVRFAYSEEALIGEKTIDIDGQAVPLNTATNW